MRIAWEYELPVEEQPRDYHFEGPISANGSKVLFATFGFAHSKDARAEDRGKRDYLVTLHSLDAVSGSGIKTEYQIHKCSTPPNWVFIEYGDRLWLYCGSFLSLNSSTPMADLPTIEVVPIKVGSRPRFIVLDGHMIFAGGKLPCLYSVDLEADRIVWQLDLRGKKPYRVGPPILLGTEIACYGKDNLEFIEPTEGRVTRTLSIPRIDKLYSPLAIDGDLLLGYTNWSAGGVIRYSPAKEKAVWRYRRSFSGPATYCSIYRIEDVVVWVKGETEIIGIDFATGAERWSYPASPWLYSEIDVCEGDLIFGTAGRDGFIQRVEVATGRPKWSVFLRNGCKYFAYFEDSVVVGDFDGCLRRLDLANGHELDVVQLNGKVVGDVHVVGLAAHTVVWFAADGKPPRLVRVDLQ